MLYKSTPESASAVPAMFAPLAAVWKNMMDAAMTTWTTTTALMQEKKTWTIVLRQSFMSLIAHTTDHSATQHAHNQTSTHFCLMHTLQATFMLSLVA
jgi:hypothetical protein